MIDYSIQPIYLDEIGVLELEGKCFATVLQEMVDSKLDLVLTVRRDLLERVVERFHIKEYTIVETD
ncbi:MAG: nucleoside-triphosphatase [Bacillus subtilis]|nr:nucleoside-triphosphatase [Bacillus subtilis]